MALEPPVPLPPDPRRLIVYAVADTRTAAHGQVVRALRALRAHAGRLIVIGTGTDVGALDKAHSLADEVIHFGSGPFSRAMYARAIADDAYAREGVDEVVLTGDGWFGPVDAGLAPVFESMATASVHLWELVEERDGEPRGFTAQGFPIQERPYLWLALRGDLVTAERWHTADATPPAVQLKRLGYSASAVYTSADLGHGSPALYAVHRLLAAGCPILPELPFTLYPPFLQQHAIIGSELLRLAQRRGFDSDEILAKLALTVAPKALNTNLALLTVIPDHAPALEETQRLAALAHITDLDAVDEVIARVEHLPAGYDLFVTTTDGRRAAKITERLSRRHNPRFRRFEVRVTPANRGRDMSDMFIACRDVLMSDDYDIVAKIHARPMRRKTRAVRSYFRRFYFENLFDSDDHVRHLLALFTEERGLGLVFPPMIHIGYQTMGRAWGAYRAGANRLAQQLGIQVPLDVVSPLAPFGGMFFARLEAVRTLAQHEWTYRDYGPWGDRKYTDLAKVQERLIVAAAAERGYHSRTVMTPAHAEISHTALEYKADQIFSTTSGYPVDQIAFLQRAGKTGRGGVVGLSRMYLSLNHPRISRVVLPAMRSAEHVYTRTKPRLDGAVRRLTRGRCAEGDR